MIKKLIASISLALVVALVPLCFVGCSAENPKSMKGTYLISSLEVTVKDKDGETTFPLENEQEFGQTYLFGEGSEQSSFVPYIVKAFDYGIGLSLKNKGVVEFYIPDDLDIEGLANDISSMSATVAKNDQATLMEDEGGEVEINITVDDLREILGMFASNLNWFAVKDKVYISGNIAWPSNVNDVENMMQETAGDVEKIKEGFRDLGKVDIGEAAYLMFTFDKKAKTLNGVFSVTYKLTDSSSNVSYVTETYNLGLKKK